MEKVAVTLLLSALRASERALARGGMGPSNHLPLSTLKARRGVEPSAMWLLRVQRPSVPVAGCSGSFVSSSGLTPAKRHCAEACVPRLSMAQQRLRMRASHRLQLDEHRVCPGHVMHALRDGSEVTLRIRQRTGSRQGENTRGLIADLSFGKGAR